MEIVRFINFFSVFHQTSELFSDTRYIVFAIERSADHNVSDKAGFANYFSKLIVDFRKLDLSPKLVKRFVVFFRYIIS